MGVTCSTPFRTRSRFGRSVRCTPIDHRFVVNSGGVDSSSSNLKTSQRCRVNTRQVKITNTFCGSVSCFHYFSDEPYFVQTYIYLFIIPILTSQSVIYLSETFNCSWAFRGSLFVDRTGGSFLYEVVTPVKNTQYDNHHKSGTGLKSSTSISVDCLDWVEVHPTPQVIRWSVLFTYSVRSIASHNIRTLRISLRPSFVSSPVLFLASPVIPRQDHSTPYEGVGSKGV